MSALQQVRAAASAGSDGITYLPHAVCVSSMLATWVMLCTAPSWPSPHFACHHKHAGDSENSIKALPPSTSEGRKVLLATCQSVDSTRELHGERLHATMRLPRRFRGQATPPRLCPPLLVRPKQESSLSTGLCDLFASVPTRNIGRSWLSHAEVR